MKNYINYYYNFKISNIFLKNKKYFFNSQLEKYEYFSKPILNRFNNIITIIDGKKYILFSIKKFLHDEISIFDINPSYTIDMNSKKLKINHFPWIDLWEKKIDYVEKWFNSCKNRYYSLTSIFNYFIGISENALLYLKETMIDNISVDNLTFQHNRISTNTTLIEYYNPSNLVIDHFSRDISEYIKSCIINKIWDFELIKEYLNKYNIKKTDAQIMYARILYPSFFFDKIEKYIKSGNINEIMEIENIISNYNIAICQISNYFLKKYRIIPINWIIKNDSNC